MSTDVFISYASSDLLLAETVYRRLVDAGFSVWFDKARLNPGCAWHEEIEAGCEASRVILPILTPRWKPSEWTRFETYGHDVVVPLVFESSFDEVFTPPLKRFQADTIDLTHENKRDWDRLISIIRARVAQPVADKAKRLISIKHPHSRHFVGREEELNEICEKLFAAPQPGLNRGSYLLVVAGIGGAGKTTLVRAYAEKLWRLYPMMFWVDCRAGLQSEFARLHDELFPERANMGLKDADKAARALLELKQRELGRLRLLIIDNAESEDEATPWIPQTGDCHTIITSRFSGWTAGKERVAAVNVLDAEPSRQLLVRRAGRQWETMTAAERDACDALARKLGYLPLALEQAAAYIEAQQDATFGFVAYLPPYDRSQRHFLALQSSRGSTNYPASVYATWRTTIDKLPAGARAILRLSAFLAATAIPTELFIAGFDAVKDRMSQFPARGDESEAALPAEVLVRQWRADLLRYSMIQPAEKGDFSVHMLVQTVERLEIPEADQAAWAREATSAFVRFSPAASYAFENWAVWKKLLPHGQALWQHAQIFSSADAEVGLPARIARFLEAQGDSASAEPLFRRALEARERVLGVEHPHTLNSVHDLALLLERKGDYASAEPLFRRALEVSERVMGAEHADTLTSMNALAVLLERKGDIASAEPIHRRALEAFERVLGAEHPQTLTSVGNLALLLERKGDYASAEPLCRRALKARERVLGAEHPQTLTSVNSLAVLLDRTGDTASAEPLFRRALEARERVLGVEHPHTLNSVFEMALLLERKGD